MTHSKDGKDYWKLSLNELKDKEDIVLIHVCDESRQTTKDFCCKRNILVNHMKYFEGFLAENENGYDDIDISVHCDVDIFEWLMCYIHSPDDPPPFDKCLVISILISSDFLQMVSLVDLCLKFVSQNLTDIIKLPIDLSCISEKLLNKLSSLTPSSVLANTVDRKDKVLNKLYKRRVELDFSRKSGPRSSIASSLTCCSTCHNMYLENYSGSLVCRKAEAVINFRGKPVRRHCAISGWSLTSYLKSLHSHGMSWECIYWHVWGACTLFRINNEVVFCASESYRYNVESYGLSINTQIFLECENLGITTNGLTNSSAGRPMLTFSLYREDDFDSYIGSELVLNVEENINSMDEAACDPSGLVLSGGVINRDNLQSGLNPIRKIDILPKDIFNLIQSQRKLISCEDHIETITTVCRQQDENRLLSTPGQGRQGIKEHDFSRILFGGNKPSKAVRNNSAREFSGGGGGGDGEETARGRSRSRSQNNKGGLSSSANFSDSNNDAGNGANSLRSRSMSGGPTRRTSSSTNVSSSGGGQGGGVQGTLKKFPSSSSVQTNGNANSNKPPLGGSNNCNTGQSLSPRKEELDEDVVNPFSTLSSIPLEVQSHINGRVGPINGIWLNTHPLTVLPQSYCKTLQTIQAVPSKDLPPNKRVEWELDLLREYDATRMEKYEEFLIKCRKNAEKQLNKFTSKPDSNVPKKERSFLKKNGR